MICSYNARIQRSTPVLLPTSNYCSLQGTTHHAGAVFQWETRAEAYCGSAGTLGSLKIQKKLIRIFNSGRTMGNGVDGVEVGAPSPPP